MYVTLTGESSGRSPKDNHHAPAMVGVHCRTCVRSPCSQTAGLRSEMPLAPGQPLNLERAAYPKTVASSTPCQETCQTCRIAFPSRYQMYAWVLVVRFFREIVMV